ncbi:unnamed protein product [Brugia pahangi]|uniref:Uncharacterized protein n=1 Tax=Brugia pahangi TaxID=6280 RepID=A0A3P7U1M2_BRUPA|nr:unnamed protein product [Brugia pahangi]
MTIYNNNDFQVTTTVIVDTHICSIGGSVALGGLVFYFLFFHTHLPSAIEGFKTFGCNANNKITIYTQIVFNVMPPEFSEEITRTCQVNLSPTPEVSGNTDSITNFEGGNNAVQVFWKRSKSVIIGSNNGVKDIG